MLSARNIARRYASPSPYHTTTQFSTQRRQKKLGRIIRHIKYDLSRLYPNVPMPSSWMISCLIASCYDEPANEQNWEEPVMQLLQDIAISTQTPTGIADTFFELDGRTPLFPNHELFSPQQAYQFCCLAQNHLKQQFGRTLTS